MNGPEHYREAERLLVAAEKAPENAARANPNSHGKALLDVVANLLGEAQVHATLALVAAQANAELGELTPLADRPSAWDVQRGADAVTWTDVLK